MELHQGKRGEGHQLQLCTTTAKFKLHDYITGDMVKHYHVRDYKQLLQNLEGGGGIRYMDMYTPVLEQLFSRYMYTVN